MQVLEQDRVDLTYRLGGAVVALHLPPLVVVQRGRRAAAAVERDDHRERRDAVPARRDADRERAVERPLDGALEGGAGRRAAAGVECGQAAGVDREDLFFERVTPESFAASVRTHAAATLTAIGLTFVGDAVELATVDSELRAVEAHVILRCARALGLSQFDVGSVTRALDEWLGSLA